MRIEQTPQLRAEHREVIDTIKYLRFGTKVVTGMNEFLAKNKPTVEVNWDVLRMIKGAVYGAYLKMDHEGSRTIANEVLLQEGVKQKLTPRQELYLSHIDEQFALKK